MTTPSFAHPAIFPPYAAPPRAIPAVRAQTKPASRQLAAAESKGVSLRRTLVLLAILVPLAAITVVGAPYYLAPLGERVRHPLHAWLRPSGYIGQSAGILALLIFAFLWLYPLRKKWKALAFTGAVGKWLDVHVTTALALPTLLAIHSAWHADGLIGLGMISMLVVCASGVVGRYLYTRIPRAKSGVEFTRDEVASERRKLIEQLTLTTGLAHDDIDRALRVAAPQEHEQSIGRVLVALMTNDLMRWRHTRELGRRWRKLAPANRPLSARSLKNAVKLASREISLTQQSQMLTATHRVFRFWHVAHRPFAITALIAVVVHVVVVIGVGATWFR